MVAASLALASCVAGAANGIPHATDGVTPKGARAHGERVVPVPPSAARLPEGSSFYPALMLPLNRVPGHARPNIRPLLGDEIRLDALQEGQRLRSMEPGAVVTPARSMPPVEPAPAKTVAMAKVNVEGAALYALVTDTTRSRIASELRQQLMGSSATMGELPGTPRTELMQVGAGWRAVVWPFATEHEADQARRMLAARGIRTELLKF